MAVELLAVAPTIGIGAGVTFSVWEVSLTNEGSSCASAIGVEEGFLMEVAYFPSYCTLSSLPLIVLLLIVSS